MKDFFILGVALILMFFITYRTAMTHLIKQYRGRVVNSPGNDVLAEFTNAVDAVNCGVELQRELAERNVGNRSLSLRPGSAAVNFQYGNVLNFAGRFKEAIPFLKKAVRLDPKHPGWYLRSLGWAYFCRHRLEEALAVYNEWISRGPSNALAHCSLGFAFIGMGKLEEAVGMFEKASNLDPDSQVMMKPISQIIQKHSSAMVFAGNVLRCIIPI